MRKIILVASMVLISAGAQAGQSRSLSLAGGDRAAQEPATNVQAVSAVDTPRAPKSADASATADTPKSLERPKFTERPPGVDVRRQSAMQSRQSQRPSQMNVGAASRRAQMAKMKQMKMHRPGPIRLVTARIVASLHRHGIYW
jgi:hypothetical protein